MDDYVDWRKPDLIAKRSLGRELGFCGEFRDMLPRYETSSRTLSSDGHEPFGVFDKVRDKVFDEEGDPPWQD